MTVETAHDSRLLSRDGDVATYRLVLPYRWPPAALTGNYRGHWSGRHRASQRLRAEIVWLAHLAHMPRSGARHVTVGLVWAPCGQRRGPRDADNLWPLLKAACDGLARGPHKNWTGLDLVPDDTPEHMTKLDPQIMPPPDRGLWLDVELLLPD